MPNTLRNITIIAVTKIVFLLEIETLLKKLVIVEPFSSFSEILLKFSKLINKKLNDYKIN